MTDHYPLRPGEKTDIIVDIDETAETIDVRQSLIYDVEGDRAVLAQTSFPLTRRHVESMIMLTVLRQEGKEKVRHGCRARVIDILSDYEITSKERVGAIVATIMGKPKKCNLRMHFRVTPTLNSGLEMFIDVEKISVLDISLGGARILTPEHSRHKPGDMIRVSLLVDGTRHSCQARVLRMWNEAFGFSQKRSDVRSLMAIQFRGLQKETERTLSPKITEIERIMRQKELDPQASTRVHGDA